MQLGSEYGCDWSMYHVSLLEVLMWVHCPRSGSCGGILPSVKSSSSMIT